MGKIALCIGNAAYPGDALGNPCNDARDISASLKKLGFVVHQLTDASAADMENALRAFSGGLDSAQVGLFFFAGHGMQIDGVNFLTAVNTNFATEVDAKYTSLSLDKVLDILERGGNATSIVLLDACRNNPYERRWRGSDTRGLAPIYAPKGTIIAYATSPGQTASDGSGRNGAFTTALLRHIETPNIAIEELFKRVRNTLSAGTLGKQISWEHTSLMGDFFFNPAVLTGEMTTSYSKEAIADRGFICHAARPLSGALEALRSHNWHRQNPAIKELSRIDLHSSSPDELFVLGRNLYQVACGGSNTADTYFTSLRDHLKSNEDETAFHLLNGILFEIYFNSDGQLRGNMKSDRLEDVFYIEEDPHFEPSFQFCRDRLNPYRDQLFYIPLDLRDVVFDAVLKTGADGSTRTTELLSGGENVLYAADGKTLPENAQGWIESELSVREFEDRIIRNLAIPRRRIRVTYSLELAVEDTIVVPTNFVVHRLNAAEQDVQ